MSTLPLPTELFIEITEYLSVETLRTFSLVSRLFRKLVLPYAFAHVKCIGSRKVRMHGVLRKDIKEVIRKLEFSETSWNSFDDHDVFLSGLTQFLQTVPNLNAFAYRQEAALHLRAKCLTAIIAALRHSQIREFELVTGVNSVMRGPPSIGLSNLKKISIGWYLPPSQSELKNSSAHIWKLIRPSLTTVVDLKILNYCRKGNHSEKFWEMLRPAGGTLRSFEYALHPLDGSILNVIPGLFPRLNRLSIMWDSGVGVCSISWKDTYMDTLSEMKHLTDLTLSMDFEMQDNDHVTVDNDFAWFLRCYKRRLQITQRIASVCKQLERCTWVQLRSAYSQTVCSMSHPFVIEKWVDDGRTTRVVRGVQQTWMGKDRINSHNGEVVKCKLEDLPGEVIGQNYGLVDRYVRFRGFR